MNETMPSVGEHLHIGFIGGGTTGKTAAGYLDAVEAQMVPGVSSAEVVAYVGTADDGSVTGEMRKEYKTPAVGDLRRSISALSANQDAALDFEKRFDSESTPETVRAVADQLVATLSYSNVKTQLDLEMANTIINKAVELSEDVMNWREKRLQGVSFGHLVMTALTMESDIDTASQQASKLMQTRGEVIPVSLKSHFLKLRDGKEVLLGEHRIDTHDLNNPNDFDISLYTEPDGTSAGVPANPRALERLARNDRVIIGPGSALSSTIPATLPEGIPEQLRAVRADGSRELVLLGNIQTHSGETDGWTVNKFVGEHGRVIGCVPEVVICNDDHKGLKNPVVFDEERLREEGANFTVVVKPIRKHGDVRYDSGDQLAQAGLRSSVMHDMGAVAVALGGIHHAEQAAFAA